MATRRRAERGGALLAGVPLVVLLGACGGAPTATDSVSPSPSASPSPSLTSATRPEGPWTLVAWTTERSDTEVEQRLSRVLLVTMSSGCPSGPCELTLSPAGGNGTYREPGLPVREGSMPLTVPFVLAWDGAAYSGALEPRTSSCTTAKGEVVPDGYTTTLAMSFTFVPPAAGTPARVHGTTTEVAKGTAKGKPKGCTDYRETEALGGVPTGSLDATAGPTGEFDATMVTTVATTPKQIAPAGSRLWLGTMKAGGDAAAPTITGLTGSTGPLTAGADGWAASPPTAPMQCGAPDGSPVDGGADGTEVFGALRPVALTEDGAPIFAGTWSLRSNPNATGLKSRCSLATYEGRIYLVPRGAG